MSNTIAARPHYAETTVLTDSMGSGRFTDEFNKWLDDLALEADALRDESVFQADTDASSWGFVLDEDDMSSDSATKLATQQSVKAYVDDSHLLTVGVIADLTSNKSLTAGNQATLTGWTEVRDIGSNFNATSGVFTAPLAGLYHVTGSATSSGNSDQDRFRSIIQKNGSDHRSFYAPTSGTAFSSAPFGMVLDLAVDDTVNIDVLNSDTGSNIVAAHTFLAITYIGNNV